ncbi:hypothetical protein [Dyella japonica]|uniref:DNA polymerase III delta prime subunit n=1 Tax=Dyella japonica TaxID=231455 RepID=A0ABV2K496_9GAMM
MAQRQLPGAGLPQLMGLAGKLKSYAKRLFDYPELDPLNAQDTAEALREPVQKEGVEFTDEAIDEIRRITQGYAYFLHAWVYQAWNLATASPIKLDVVHRAT